MHTQAGMAQASATVARSGSSLAWAIQRHATGCVLAPAETPLLHVCGLIQNGVTLCAGLFVALTFRSGLLSFPAAMQLTSTRAVQEVSARLEAAASSQQPSTSGSGGGDSPTADGDLPKSIGDALSALPRGCSLIDVVLLLPGCACLFPPEAHVVASVGSATDRYYPVARRRVTQSDGRVLSAAHALVLAKCAHTNAMCRPERTERRSARCNYQPLTRFTTTPYHHLRPHRRRLGDSLRIRVAGQPNDSDGAQAVAGAVQGSVWCVLSSHLTSSSVSMR